MYVFYVYSYVIIKMCYCITKCLKYNEFIKGNGFRTEKGRSTTCLSLF